MHQVIDLQQAISAIAERLRGLQHQISQLINETNVAIETHDDKLQVDRDKADRSEP